MKTENYYWIDFLSGRNVIKVTNENEFNMFKKFLDYLGITEILGNTTTYEELQQLAAINYLDENLFLFEYDNCRGLTWSDNIKKAIQWYDKEPINVDDLEILKLKNVEKNTEKNGEIDYDYN